MSLIAYNKIEINTNCGVDVKKYLLLLIAFVAIIGLSACGKTDHVCIDIEKQQIETEEQKDLANFKPDQSDFYIENANETTVSEHKVVEENVVEDDIIDNRYVLLRKASYYKGSIPENKIEKIVFTNEHPEEYDEKWNANEADTEDIVGYLHNSTVYIVGEKIRFNQNSRMMFCGVDSYGEEIFSNVKEIDGLDIVDTSLVKNAAYMFAGNKYIKHLDVGGWDVSNVTNMKFMFSGCISIEELDVENWNVQNVEKFTSMFQGSSHIGDMSLRQIDVSKWNTMSVDSLNHMFYGCGKLEYIDVSNWDVSKVRTFSHMFADCFSLKQLDLSNWKTDRAVSFDAIFNDCKSLKSIDISNLNTSQCLQFSQMFESCESLVEIKGIENLDVSQASNYAFSEMFHNCKSLTSLDLSKWNTSNADNFARMFAKCSELKELNLSGFSLENAVTMLEMFDQCPSDLKIIGYENWDLKNIDTTNMF